MTNDVAARPRRRLGRRPIALALLSSTLALGAGPAVAWSPPPNPDRPATAQVSGYGATITVLGRGNGHGDGLSQYGAYGYATLYDWDWHQILAHYYGGTTEAQDDPGKAIQVRLRGLDDEPFTALVSATGKLVTNVQGASATTYKSVVAVETTAGNYKVYGRTADAVCPAGASATTAELDKPTSGWTVINAGVASTSSTSTARLEVSASGVAPDTATFADLVGVCQPPPDAASASAVKLYRGSIQIVNGTLSENRTVNKVAIDQYLRGVVPRESPSSWGNGKGANALSAQAVAARTYALVENRYTYARTCDTDSCQVYGAAARRASATDAIVVLETATTDTAITATSGIVLHKADGTLAFTQFNSASGGFTSGANFPAVEDLGDAVASNPHFRWTTTLQRTDLEAAYPAVGVLQSIEVLKRNGLGEWGGRALRVAVRGTKGTVEVTGEQFRSASGLRSAWFYLPSGCDGPNTTGPLAAVTPTTFHAIAPARVVDTRIGQGASLAPIVGGCVLPVRVASLVDLPSAAEAVSLSVTVVNPVAAGFVTVYPCQTGRPLASSLNYRASQTVANQTIVSLDSADEVCLSASQTTDVVVDVLGWFGGVTGSQLAALPPARLLDTRGPVGGRPGVVPSTGTVAVDVFGAGGVPAGSTPTAVVVNLTSTGAAGEGFLVAYACDAPRPSTSNLNTGAGRDVAAHAVVAVSADGHVCIYSNVSTNVVVDIAGWYRAVLPPPPPVPPAPTTTTTKAPSTTSPATTATTITSTTTTVPTGRTAPTPGTDGRLVPTAPVRLLDTRAAGSSVVAGGTSVAIDPVADGHLGTVTPGTVVVNVTATDAVAGGFLTVYPCGGDVPLASAVNYAARTDVANLVTVPVGVGGKICVFSNQTTHIVVDLAAWYT